MRVSNVGLRFLFVSSLSLGVLAFSQKNTFAQPSKASDDYGQVVAELLTKFKKRPLPEATGQARSESEEPILLQHCLADEGEFFDIQNQVLHPLREGIIKGDKKLLGSILSVNAEVFNFSLVKRQKLAKLGNIERFTWDISPKNTLTGRTKGADAIESFSSSGKVIDVDIHVSSMIAGSDRRNADYSLRAASLKTYFDIRILKGTYRKTERFFADVLLEKINDTWHITRLLPTEGELLQSAKPGFKEVTEEALGNSVPTYQRLEAIRRGGFALSLGDFDGDNNADLYVGTHGNGVLLRGDGKGKFIKVSYPEIEAVTRVKSAIWADFTNQGRKDLLLVRYATEYGDKGKLERPPESDFVLFANLGGGKFERRKILDRSYLSYFAMPATAADFNSDGKLDIYIGFPGVKDFTSAADSNPSPQKAHSQGIFLNQGLKFEPQFNLLPDYNLDDDRFVSQRLLPHSALAVDFNDDSTMDILVVDDHGNLSPAYSNDGKGNFRQVNEAISFNNEGYGMGVASGDFNNDGFTDLALTNVSFFALDRLASSCDSNFGYQVPKIHSNKHLRVFQGTGSGKFVETSDQMGLISPGEGLAGVSIFDFDGDGFEDILVSNGLWSGTDRKSDLGNIYYGYQKGIVSVNLMDEGAPTQSLLMRTLLNYQGSITGGSATSRPSLGGFQRKRLYRNLGNSKFLEIGFLEGVDSIADGYTMAIADINSDQVPDLIFRNGDPGVLEQKFSPVQVFQNLNPQKNRFVSLKLKGTRSNSDGIGARVKFITDRTKLSKQLLANNGTVQSDTSLFFGFKATEKAKEIEISWPSGLKQRLVAPFEYRILIEEPKSF